MYSFVHKTHIQVSRLSKSFVFVLSSCAVSESSKLQPTVGSTSLAVFMVVLWLRTLLVEVGTNAGAKKIWCDSQGVQLDMLQQ